MRKPKRRQKILASLLTFVLLFGVLSQSVAATTVDASETSVTEQSAETSVEDHSKAEATEQQPETQPPEETQPETQGKTEETVPETAQPQSDGEKQTEAESKTEETVPEGTEQQPMTESVPSETSTENPDQSEEKPSEAATDTSSEEMTETDTKNESSEENTETETAEAFNSEPIFGESTYDGVTVSVSAPTGSFPEGTALTITALSQEAADEIAEAILSGSEAIAFDISFFSATGEKVQPADGKTVEVTFAVTGDSKLTKAEEEQAALQVYHISSDNRANQMANIPAPNEGESAEVSVEATQFSTYLCLKAAVQPQRKAPPEQNRVGGVDAGAHVHCTITTESTAVSNGQYVSFVVKYQVDHGSIHEDDYITVTIPDSLKNVDLQLDPKHFKGYEKQADGTYHLIFNDNADGIAGSFSLNVTASNESTSAVTATVDVNGTKSSVTISGLTPSGSGIGKAVEKSAFDGSSIQYGGYDYSTGTGVDATEIGIYTPSSDVTASFHIDVNHSGQEMWNVTVTDDVPVMDGVIYNHDLQIGNLDGATYTNQSNDNHIRVSFDHLSPDQRPRLTYSVTIKAGTTLKVNNNAVLDYTSQTGGNETVIDRFQLKPGNGYSAADAYKSVDKTVVSGDPADQTVKYTITFDPDKEFEAGELRLEDKLNEYVRYLYSYGDSAFDVSYDEATHTVHMVNNRTVEGNQKKTVTIVTDFSEVPEGTDVANTVGNTVHTLKYKGELELNAGKTVDGAAPGDAKFEFQLLDEAGQVLQTKENDAQGSIVFDKIYYGKDDLGKTYTYTVKESSDADGFSKDEAVYTVKVTPKDEDGNGILEVEPEITKDGQTASDITFDNKKIQGKLEIRKSVSGDLSLGSMSETQKSAIKFEITGPGQYNKTVTLADMQDGVLTLSDLVPGTYTVKETGADLPGYTVETTYSAGNGEAAVESGKTAEVEIRNKYASEKVSIPVKKIWVGKPGTQAEVSLKADGRVMDTKTLTAATQWEATFTELAKYDSTDGHEISYTLSEVTVPGYESVVTGDALNGFTVTNTITGKTSIEVTKKWVGPAGDSATVRVMNGEKEVASQTLNEGNNWQYTFNDLDKYDADGKEIPYTLKEDSVDGYSSEITGDLANGFTVTNTRTPETISISGEKTWDDNDNQDGARPESITIRLQGGDEPQEKTVTAADEWKWSFDNLPKYKDGQEIQYSITEDAVSGYSAAVNGYDVTNTHTPGKTSVSVTKKWKDQNDQDGKRPNSVTIHLYADDVDTGKTVTLSEANNWSDSFTDLDEYKDGVKINYTVKEDEVAEYTSVTGGDAAAGYTVTNTHTPETINVHGVKTWDDNNNQDGARPESITIRLSDGTTEQVKTVTEADNWEWSFNDLPKYKDGVEITYTITEDAVSGYSAAVNGYDVTNTHTPGKTSVSVTKAWDDSNNQDGKRPNNVTVHLYADDVDTGKTVTLSEANNWSDSFTDLDEYKDGVKINYTVKEDAVAEYTSVTSGDAAAGYTVTNTHTPETINVQGSKTWEDKDNQDGIRPDTITIRLLANGTEKDSVDVNADDGWSWEFKDLPKYENGTEILYTITEDVIEDYTPEVNGYDVMNTHTPGKTSVTVTKSWNDNDDQDGIRPEKIIIHLLADGEDTGKTLELSAENSWTGSFADLDEKKNGQKIVYTVSEEKVTGYDEPAVSGDAVTGFVVTNVHKPETVELSGKKIWDDANNQDGVRPETITIRLLADGVEKDRKEVTESDHWSWKFSDLPKYRGGVEIKYTITEDAVAEYTSDIEGYDVTNKHTPGKTSVTVTKVWDDKDDQDGVRADSVTIHLLADGVDTGKTLVLNASNDWTGSFTDLDEKHNGKAIVYTVEEEEVSGYTVTITGNQTKGFTVTNVHTPKKPGKPDKPSKPDKPDTSRKPGTSPKTGDESNLMLWFSIMAVALLFLILDLLYLRKRRKLGR